MKHTGILFTPENYDKVLMDLKPMTRRLKGLEKVNVTPDAWRLADHSNGIYLFKYKQLGDQLRLKCPFGTVKDWLYVKEGLENVGGCIQYRRDHVPVRLPNPNTEWPWNRATLSPLHMPKWAARLWLELTEVRVERLQEISADDCKAEGVELGDEEQGHDFHYMNLWESINEDDPWDSNPWVWVLSYKKVGR